MKLPNDLPGYYRFLTELLESGLACFYGGAFLSAA